MQAEKVYLVSAGSLRSAPAKRPSVTQVPSRGASILSLPLGSGPFALAGLNRLRLPFGDG